MLDHLEISIPQSGVSKPRQMRLKVFYEKPFAFLNDRVPFCGELAFQASEAAGIFGDSFAAGF